MMIIIITTIIIIIIIIIGSEKCIFIICMIIIAIIIVMQYANYFWNYFSTVLMQLLSNSVRADDHITLSHDQNTSEPLPDDYEHIIEQILLRSNIQKVIYCKPYGKFTSLIPAAVGIIYR